MKGLGTVKTGMMLISLLLGGAAYGDDCTLSIDATDAMQFSTKELTTKASCKEVKVTLHHTGKLPKTAMGHNWVLVATSDFATVSTDTMKAGPAKDYMVDGDAKIIAHTKLLSGGESDTITFEGSKLKAGGDYTFFCSFPGHSALMKGKLVVK